MKIMLISFFIYQMAKMQKFDILLAGLQGDIHSDTLPGECKITQ